MDDMTTVGQKTHSDDHSNAPGLQSLTCSKWALKCTDFISVLGSLFVVDETPVTIESAPRAAGRRDLSEDLRGSPDFLRAALAASIYGVERARLLSRITSGRVAMSCDLGGGLVLPTATERIGFGVASDVDARSVSSPNESFAGNPTFFSVLLAGTTGGMGVESAVERNGCSFGLRMRLARGFI